ncbi:hypothetical protein [Nocardia amamiensis]|uniref:hypothetical protein n=1 Tax=Nocardia amamiensis TaxID=404578 RepID=UPI00082E994E|nr:hypothetical protein [Nocardia amamiensis]
MTHFEDVTEQLREALDNRIVGDLQAIGALDLADMARARIDQAARRFAAALCSDDDSIAAQTVIDLAGVAWPEDPEPGWWRTPLGLAVGRSVGADTALSVSRSVAGAMLGVTKGTVDSMIARKNGSGLERHPDGGITMSSVLALLARRHQQ